MGKASFSLESATEHVRKLAASKDGLLECALRWGKYCRARGYDVQLARLSKLPFAAEEKALKRWFDKLWRASPPREQNKGFWFGINEFAEGEQSFEDVYWGVTTSASLDIDASEWGWGKGSQGSTGRYAGSKVLAQLWATDGPTPKAETRHVFLLGYVALLAARLCLKLPKAKRTVHRIVAAGYDEGDYMLLGALTDAGFVIEQKPAPKPQSKLAAGELFKIEKDIDRQKGWLLDSPTARSGPELDDPWFGTHARREKPRPLTVKRYDSGREMDFSFCLLSVPIVNRKVADIVTAHDARSIQLLPVTLEGSRERYWLLNVIAKVPPSYFKAWAAKHRRPISHASIGRKAIARTGNSRSVLIVTRALAEALVQAQVTGISLEPVSRYRVY